MSSWGNGTLNMSRVYPLGPDPTVNRENWIENRAYLIWIDTKCNDAIANWIQAENEWIAHYLYQFKLT